MSTHKQYNGVFLSTDSQFAGLLKIAGADSILKLVGKSHWAHPETGSADIHGILSDGKKVSLLDCVLQGENRYVIDGNSQFESVFFPHYAVVGGSLLILTNPLSKQYATILRMSTTF